MTAAQINAGLRVLRNYYADKKGTPHALNDVQLSVYLDGLAPFSAPELEAASRAWMRQSRWFPALSDLLELLSPAVSVADQAALAWTAVEQAIRRIGSYRSVQFADPPIGETVRQVFGTWPRACHFDFDSPGWTLRRQQFVALYPTIARRGGSAPVTLGGLHRDDRPALVAHVEGLPAPRDHALTGPDDSPFTGDEARRLLAEVEKRTPTGRLQATASEALP